MGTFVDGVFHVKVGVLYNQITDVLSVLLEYCNLFVTSSTVLLWQP